MQFVFSIPNQRQRDAFNVAQKSATFFNVLLHSNLNT
jgi:hypothetical protein